MIGTMIVVPETFRAMPRWWHDEAGRGWLDELPDLVQQWCGRWSLVVDGPLWHGSNALVVPVTRTGERYALRLTPPGDDHEAETGALRFWAGRGTVRLIESDGAAVLLERLDGSRTLATEPVEVAAPILGALVARLAVPPPDDVPSTAAFAAADRDGFAERWAALGRPVPESVLDHAVAAADRRATMITEQVATNGDLHDDQVLAATREPWLVVDPVLLRGERCYDLARELWTRFGVDTTPALIMATLDTLVASSGSDPAAARDWAIVRSMSYLLWGLEHGLTEDPPRCVQLLRVFA